MPGGFQMRLGAVSSMMILGGAMLCLAACQPKPAAAPGALLGWAYPQGVKVNLPPYPAGPQHIPGSAVTYTGEALNKGAGPPDWFPASHPPAPEVVAQGRKGLMACAECHQIGGGGSLGSPNLAGLSEDYIIQQVREFREGRRTSWKANWPTNQDMIKVAKTVTDEELAAAAAYYAALPYKPRVRVVEGETAPATRPNYYGWLDLDTGKPPQPLNGQVIEVAEDWPRMLLADPNAVIVVHAPIGATARGRALAESGGGNGQACAACHGPGLKGSPVAPPLAGRSAAYLARQLLDIKTGARHGPSVSQMQGPARGLDDEEIRDLAVYAASLRP